jgi:hypothetical protein
VESGVWERERQGVTGSCCVKIIVLSGILNELRRHNFTIDVGYFTIDVGYFTIDVGYFTIDVGWFHC